MKRLTFISAFAVLLAIVLALPAMATTTATPTGLLPAAYFAKSPEIHDLSLSPDGKHLAGVLVMGQSKGVKARYQLVVFDLPGLKVASRLKFGKNLLPVGITWLSNTRLVYSEARQVGSLDQPQGDGNIFALDYNGAHQRELYSVMNWGNPGTPFNMTSMIHGFPAVAGPTEAMDGQVFISITPFPHGEGTRNGHAQRTILYKVNSVNDYPKQIAEINHGNMSFFVLHDQALYAFGPNAHMQEVVYTKKTKRGPWQRMPASVVGKGFYPDYISADGKHLYVSSSLDGGPTQLVETHLDGSGRKVLASNSFGSVNTTFFTPKHNDKVPYAVTFAGVYTHGKPAITYLRDNRYSEVLKALNQQFGNQFVRFDGFSKDGSIALVVAYSGTDPGEAALFNMKTMHLRPLMRFEPWIKPVRIGPRVAFRYHNRKGLLLDGYLTFPAGVPHRNLPTVVMVHGGPIGPRDQWSYDPLQIAPFLANRGYAVLNVNYRGSGGRGPNFQKSGYRQFGTGIQDDIIDAVHWAIHKGYVDSQRICVFGGSFGGYSSLMQPILAPKLYQCAIDYAGVSDWSIEMTRSDTSHGQAGNYYLSKAVGTPAQARAISPLYMLKRFNVPVLIAQGGSDPRVPPENAERLRSALQAAHKPYEWLYFSGEPHGFTTEPHRLALLQKMSAFLRKYLGPGVTKATVSVKTAAPASS